MRRALSLLVAAVLVLPSFAEEKKPLRIAMFSASKEYQSVESLPILRKSLESSPGVACELINGEDKGNLSGSSALDKADVAVLFTRRVKLPAEDLARWKAFCTSGKGLVGIRTASHGLDGWPEFDHVILGGDYTGHYNDKAARLTVLAPTHFIVSGFEPFSTKGKLYKNQKPASDIVPLIRATTDEASEPVAWVREQKGQRVFYISLGVPEDFQSPAFLLSLIHI